MSSGQIVTVAPLRGLPVAESMIVPSSMKDAVEVLFNKKSTCREIEIEVELEMEMETLIVTYPSLETVTDIVTGNSVQNWLNDSRSRQ